MSTNQTFLIFVVAVILIASIVGIIGRYMSRQKLFKSMETLWQTISPLETFIRPNSHYDYEYQLYKDNYKPYTLVDDKTWSDLNMSAIFHQMNYNLTAIGEMKLYSCLRGMLTITNKSLLNLFNDNAEFRQHVTFHLALLGKSVYPTFPDQITPVKHHTLLMLCPFLPIITFAIIFINAQVGILLFLLSCLFNIILSAILKRTYEDDLKSIFYASNVLKHGYAISKVKHAPQPEVNFKHFRTARHLTSVLAEVNEEDIGAMVIKLVKLIFMLDYLLFHTIQKSYTTHMKELKNCFDYIAELDNHYSLAMYRRTLDVYTEPRIDETKNSIEFTELTHPLISDAIANDFSLSQNILLTGSNASGKSTFMKAIAINLILAKTTHTVTATKFVYQPGNVFTSMANADSVLSGDSYFMAELKSIKRIVNISGNQNIYCFIDEIFKGTNTTERIAASESVLSFLNQKPNFKVIAATHDIELAELLKNQYSNYHFNEVIENNKIHFDYKIKPGKANTRNAIELLRITSFPEQIYQRAKDNVPKI
ncbi:MutS-related protein [Staphylococcus argenteus]|uniref:MutS-related protein n=1 Tax=Staphylococcus argenteus TaxID=985002 RepID=UPI00066E10B5|nr:MutS family DNA mismatch repair protein [Staphylococcus argenteus]